MCGFTAKNTKGKVKMELQQIIMLITIAVYLIMMVVVGVICAKKTDNVGDFYLGGRKLGPFVTAMSAEASDMSGWLLMGLPGVCYGYCGRCLDRYRSCDRHISQLAYRIKKNQKVFSCMQFDNYTGFLLKQIQGQQEDTYSYLGADNHSILYSLYRLGIFRLRQAVQQSFRC